MKPAPWLLGAMLTPLCLVPTAQAAPVTFNTLVQASQLPYSGEQVINGRTVIRITQGPGDRHRQEVLAPAGMAGELVIDNGRTRYHYSPRTGTVDITPTVLAPHHVGLSAQLLAKNFKLAQLGKDTVAGHKTQIVELRPLHAGRPSQRLWLDAATGLPLKIQRLAADGTLIETSEFRSIQISAKPDPDAFEFAMPPRARVATAVQVLASGHSLADLKVPVPFPVKMPGYLPPGFEVLDVHLFETKGVRSIHWRLSDGLDMLSLFQTAREHRAPMPPAAHMVAIDHGQGFMVGHGSHHMLCWDSPSGAFTLVGDLPEQELERVAASTGP